MRRLLIGTLALTLTFPPLPAQKIETETPVSYTHLDVYKRQAFVDRITALKIVAGVVLLWTLQNQPTVFECIRKLFSFVQRRPSVREYRGGVTTVRAS